jgi:hypothetical protein
LLIVTRFDLTHADAQIHGAVVAKVFADLAVIGVDGNQTGIGGWQEQTTGHAAGCVLSVTLSRCVVFKIAQTAAALPVWRGGFGIVAPFFFTGIHIQRQHFTVRGTDIQRVANLQRRVLIFRAGAVALRNIAGVRNPGDFQIADVLFVDLVQRGKAVAVGGVTPVLPVFLLLAGATGFTGTGSFAATRVCGLNIQPRLTSMATASTAATPNALF